MAYNPKGLLRKFINNTYADELEQVRSLHQQSKISIDYNLLNTYLIDTSGKDFWDWQMYTFMTVWKSTSILIILLKSILVLN